MKIEKDEQFVRQVARIYFSFWANKLFTDTQPRARGAHTKSAKGAREAYMWLLLLLALILMMVAVALLLLTEYRMEVKVATALVYNNIWTGRTGCFLPGTNFLIPGIHKVLEKEVSLKNEAENPSNVSLFTADGIEIEVDYIVRRLQVGWPDMPKYEAMSTETREHLGECAIWATTRIKYGERRDKILTRVVARLQEALESRTLNQIFLEADLKTGESKCNLIEMVKIEDETNKALLKDIVTTEWGFWVEIDLEDYNLPAIIRRAREKGSSAEIAGRAIKTKLEHAGVPENARGLWAGIATIAETLIGAIKNEEKKEGSS